MFIYDVRFVLFLLFTVALAVFALLTHGAPYFSSEAEAADDSYMHHAQLQPTRSSTTRDDDQASSSSPLAKAKAGREFNYMNDTPPNQNERVHIILHGKGWDPQSIYLMGAPKPSDRDPPPCPLTPRCRFFRNRNVDCAPNNWVRNNTVDAAVFVGLPRMRDVAAFRRAGRAAAAAAERWAAETVRRCIGFCSGGRSNSRGLPLPSRRRSIFRWGSTFTALSTRPTL
mmetsp:Transcript_7658/g.15971  ORF Transcript_7658/g.15971 Transcript_7658/m.15971 type:complete len:227 (+) Transcript_7658:307-987(+)